MPTGRTHTMSHFLFVAGAFPARSSLSSAETQLTHGIWGIRTPAMRDILHQYATAESRLQTWPPFSEKSQAVLQELWQLRDRQELLHRLDHLIDRLTPEQYDTIIKALGSSEQP